MEIPTGDIPNAVGPSASYPGSAFSEYCASTTVPYYSYSDYQLDAALNTYNLGQTPGGSQTNLNPLVSETLASTPWTYPGLASNGSGIPGLTLSGSPHGCNLPKRKRKTTPIQRVAANNRERRRMCNLNTAFDKLRKKVPTFPHEKRLSRIQTLKLAMTYIGFMTEVLTGQDIEVLIKQQQQQQAPGQEGLKTPVWQPFDAQQVIDPAVFLQSPP